jgi:DNA-binding transcriptional LysR family regulator
MDEARTLVQELGEAGQEYIRIAAGGGPLRQLVLPAAAEFRKTAPHVQFRMREDGYDSMLSLVEHRDIDLAVTPYLPRMDSLRWEPLYKARLYALMAPSHSLAGNPLVTVDELATEDLLLPREAGSTRFVKESLCRLYGLETTCVLESDQAETLRAALGDDVDAAAELADGRSDVMALAGVASDEDGR